MKTTTKQFTCICLAVIMIAMSIIPITAFAAESDAAVQSMEVDGFSIHEMDDNSGYYPNESNKVSVFGSGHTSLGTLKVNGDVKKTTYKGYDAYAIYGDEISFEYLQTWNNASYNGHDWKLSNDTFSSISGITTGAIGNGAFVVMKSTDDGATWTSTGATSVNINGTMITFTPDGSDIAKGVLYTVIAVGEVYYTYQSGTKKDWIFWPFKYKNVPVYSNHYQNLAQVYTFYIGSDSCQAGFYSGATDAYDVSSSFEGVSTETLEIMKKGTSLTNGSVSFDYIRVDKLGNSSLDIRCSYNNSSYFTVSDFETFTKPGYYRFLLTTKFLTQKAVDLWILDPGDDYAYSLYFKNGFVSQDKRVFDKSSQIPMYMVGTAISISPEENLPGLYGNIFKFSDSTAVAEDKGEVLHTFVSQTTDISITLNEPGIYAADLYVGDPNAGGNTIHYTFCFAVTNNPEYKPMVNYEMLTSADRHIMLKSVCYAVNFATTSGGSYIFVFPATSSGYDAALEFAEKIEYRFIEEFTDNNGITYYYYKGHSSSWLKTRFDSKVELYQAIRTYAEDNVHIIYTNANESYATMSLDEAIDNIENCSIKNDIKVCLETMSDELVSEDIIINGYKFYQIAPFESSSIIATGEDGVVYNIPYDTNIEEILPFTGKYLICESNWFASHSYYVTYIAANDITGTVSFKASKDHSEFYGTISSGSNSVIEANSITLICGEDKYDSQTIVTVSCLGKRTNMLLSELKEYTLSEPGTYTVTLTNRCGNELTTTLIITEPTMTDTIQQTPSNDIVFESIDIETPCHNDIISDSANDTTPVNAQDNSYTKNTVIIVVICIVSVVIIEIVISVIRRKRI